LVHQALENGATMRAQRALATKYNYTTWKLESPIFPLVKATGFNVKDWQDLILVNQVGNGFTTRPRATRRMATRVIKSIHTRPTITAMPRGCRTTRTKYNFVKPLWR
jgi:hypothetical protein